MNLPLRHVFGFEPDLDEEQAEYRRPPRIQAGTLELEAQSTIGEVYLAAPAPRWTTDAPTHEGIWWVRVPGAARKVAEVFRGRDGKLRMRWTDYGPFLIPRTGLEWSDRAITVPLETRA